MLTKPLRFFKHRWLGDDVAAKVLPADVLAQLTRSVHASEQKHSGEIRIYIEAGLPTSYLWRDGDMPHITRSRALSLFGKLRVWDTAQNNGVLIYLLLAERAIEIVADRGLNDKVSPATWQVLVERMRMAFRHGEFEAGLKLAVQEVNDLLMAHFPLNPGEVNHNELPDAPILR